MSIPTGQDIFDGYLSTLESDLAQEDPPLKKPTEDEARTEFDDYLQEKLSSQFDGSVLENILGQAEAAFDYQQVLDQYP
jgi:hypothetical protein